MNDTHDVIDSLSLEYLEGVEENSTWQGVGAPVSRDDNLNLLKGLETISENDDLPEILAISQHFP